jgi:endonuclease YncB( thermonuclease family)
MRPAIIICVVAALMPAVASAQATSFLTGPARVIDGDTIIVAGEPVRLEGIDAPERKQSCKRDGRPWACGSVAAQTLRGLIRNREVSCRAVGRDAYGRALGVCSAEQVNLNAAMVRSGFALDFRRYSSAYIADEAAAKADRAGMWSGTFVPPWEWRQSARATAARPSGQPAGPDGCTIKGNVNRRGERIYHLPGSRDYGKVVINTAKGERWFCTKAEAAKTGWRPRR